MTIKKRGKTNQIIQVLAYIAQRYIKQLHYRHQSSADKQSAYKRVNVNGSKMCRPAESTATVRIALRWWLLAGFCTIALCCSIGTIRNRLQNRGQTIDLTGDLFESTAKPVDTVSGATELLAASVLSNTTTAETPSTSNNEPITAAANSNTITPLVATAPKHAQASGAKPGIKNLDNKQAVVIQAGDTLSKIFARYHLKQADALAIGRLPGAQTLRRLQVGKILWLELQDGLLQRLEYNDHFTKHLVVTANKTGWSCQDRTLAVKSQNYFLPVQLDKGQNFSHSCLNSGVPQNLIGEIKQALGQRMDLGKIKPADRLYIAYKRDTVDGRVVKRPELIGLDYYFHSGKTDQTQSTGTNNKSIANKHNKQNIRLIAFDSGNGQRSYFTPDGQGIRSQFNRYPLNTYIKISSRFSRARRHPIYGTVKPHLGIDLSASYGTPVYATSDGIVELANFHGGYGRLVIIKNGVYSTRYAHLSRFGKNIVKGARVQRGRLIGYVGSSGVSTSAHLHYEFRIRGVPYDPTKVKLPGESLLATSQRHKFLAIANGVGSFLDREQAKYHRGHNNLAKSDQESKPLDSALMAKAQLDPNALLADQLSNGNSILRGSRLHKRPSNLSSSSFSAKIKTQLRAKLLQNNVKTRELQII